LKHSNHLHELLNRLPESTEFYPLNHIVGWGTAPFPAYTMVLLTSSSISVAISSAVVFLFTFLLFLSGYVVQQQTVRSLQAALHPPPMPTPKLPVYFQTAEESAQIGMATATEVAKTAGAQTDREEKLEGFQTITKSDPEPSALAENEDQMEVQNPPPSRPVTEASSAGVATPQSAILNEKGKVTGDQPSPVAPSESEPTLESPARLAYVQLLSSPSQICSALLFLKLQMDYGDADISRVILYPSVWEQDTSSEPFTTALALLRLVKDEYKITYHPVQIDDSPEEQGIERELVAHLATHDWKYDRMMYLRSPGLALNIGALDSALQASQTKPLLSRNWARANPEPSTAPSILLVSDHGIHTPRGSNRRLTAEAFTSHANHHENEMDVEAAAHSAAYVHFEEGELEHRRTEKEWYGGVFERYERGRSEICKGVSFEGGRTELRKVRKRGWR
jgi:hypothetical protein